MRETRTQEMTGEQMRSFDTQMDGPLVEKTSWLSLWKTVFHCKTAAVHRLSRLTYSTNKEMASVTCYRGSVRLS